MKKKVPKKKITLMGAPAVKNPLGAAEGRVEGHLIGGAAEGQITGGVAGAVEGQVVGAVEGAEEIVGAVEQTIPGQAPLKKAQAGELHYVVVNL